MKIVLIGGGSFVFAPTVLEDVIVKQRLACELVLVDLNKEAVEAMAGAGKRISDELGVSLQIRGVTDRREALPGADYVIVSASPQGIRRWQMDYAILKEFDMADQARECGGLGGMMNAFRSITLILDICRDMEFLCPDAVLLDVTNPMPRVVTAIHRFTSIQGIGFCNIAYRGADGYEFLPNLLGLNNEDVQIITAGLNHFAWLVEMKSKHTGEDFMPALTQYLQKGDWSGQPVHSHRELTVMRRWLEEYGGIAAGSVDHHAEYLPIQQDIYYATTPPYHGSETERRQRLQELREIASEKRDWSHLFSHGSWEHPVDVAVALDQRLSKAFDILNIPNRGYIPEIPDGRIVEVPAFIQNGNVSGKQVSLSGQISDICRKLSDVHEMVAEAAACGDLGLARQVIEVDPAIENKRAGLAAFHKMLEAHKDLLPQFG